MIITGSRLLRWDSEGPISLYDLERFVENAYWLFVKMHSKDEHFNDAYVFYLDFFNNLELRNPWDRDDDMSLLSNEEGIKEFLKGFKEGTVTSEHNFKTYVESLVPNYEKLINWSMAHDDYLSYLGDYEGKWRTYEDMKDSDDDSISSLSDLSYDYFDPGFCEDLVYWSKERNKKIDGIGYDGVRDIYHEFLLSLIWINWKKEGIFKSVTSCYIKFKLEQLMSDSSTKFTEETFYLIDNKLKQEFIDFVQNSSMRWLGTLGEYLEDRRIDDDYKGVF